LHPGRRVCTRRVWWLLGPRASCTGDIAEEWSNVYNSYYGRTVFESVYNSGLCLTVNFNTGNFLLEALAADPCTDDNSTMPWEQLWGTS
jgi:hypothetical protein